MMTGDKRFRRAQATIEVTLGLMITALLLIAAAKIFVWINEGMVIRQEVYQRTSDDLHWIDTAGQSPTGVTEHYRQDADGYIRFADEAAAQQGPISLTFEVDPKGKVK